MENNGAGIGSESSVVSFNIILLAMLHLLPGGKKQKALIQPKIF